MKKLLILLALLTWTLPLLAANEPLPTAHKSNSALSPTDVVAKYYEEIEKGNIYSLGKFYSDHAKSEFRTLADKILEINEVERDPLVKEFFGAGRKPYHLKLMSDEEVLSAILEYFINVKQSLPDTSTGKTEVMGHIFYGDNMAYVLTKTVIVMGDSSLDSLEVMPIKLIGNEWQLELRHDLKSFSAVFDKIIAEGLN